MNRPRTAWQRWRKWLAAAFLLAVAVLLVNQARNVDWPEVARSIRGTDPLLLMAAIAIAAVSYLLYASYDVMARRYTGHALPTSRVAAIAMVSYAFNLNMGALIGGAGFRFRLYSRFGLPAATITRILSFSVISNWAGYVVLAGMLLVLQQLPVQLQWDLGKHAMRVIGALLLLVVAAWLLLCGVSKRRNWILRGHEVELPSLQMALLQIGLSSANWMTIASIVYLLLPSGPDYPTVLTVLLAAAVAGAATHVPAGLGVLEAVFAVALGSQLGTPAVLAALLTYRAIYYLIPLAVAVPAYLMLEREAGKHGDATGESAQPDPG
jgi:glycosyltransferase 2 family protein